MFCQRLGKGLLWPAVFTLLLTLAPGVVHAASLGKFSAGMTLPAFKVPAPDSADEGAYLGVKGSEPFALSQIAGKMVIIDLLNAF